MFKKTNNVQFQYNNKIKRIKSELHAFLSFNDNKSGFEKKN